MVGLTYETYKNQIATMAVVEVDNENFISIIPEMIMYAELRSYRDLDLQDNSGSFTGETFSVHKGARLISFNKEIQSISSEKVVPPDAGTFLISEQINLILPAGSTNPNNQAYRIALLPTTKEFLDAVYGSSQTAQRGVPKYYAPFNDSAFIVGPYADAKYYVEIIGTYRPIPLSEDNTTTTLSQYFPDIFIMASMIYISAYQRNFGKFADEPDMANSYEAQYNKLLMGASVEEARKKYEAAAWTSQAQAKTATPSR